MKKDAETSNRMCKRALNFFNKRNEMRKDDIIVTENFEIIEVRHPIQEDTNNCGAFIIFFISEITRIDSLTDISTDFNPASFRIELQKRCLRFSVDMTNICMICGEKEKKKHDWCQCKKCLRWVHYPCLDVNIPFVDLEKSTCEFACPLCESE